MGDSVYGGGFNDGAKDEINGQALEEEDRGERQEESAERREKEILPESTGAFLLKLLQADGVWDRCGPVASLALGSEEQVVAPVGGGGEVELAQRTNMRLKRQKTGSQGHSFSMKSCLSKKTLVWHAEHSLAQTGALG